MKYASNFMKLLKLLLREFFKSHGGEASLTKVYGLNPNERQAKGGCIEAIQQVICKLKSAMEVRC